MASERITLDVAGRDVSLSSPHRVIWPELGITKQELAEYVIAVAEPFLRANGLLIILAVVMLLGAALVWLPPVRSRLRR